MDWAAHANEPVAVTSDILAFDRAVKSIPRFCKNRDTVVIAVSDHETGGLTICDVPLPFLKSSSTLSMMVAISALVILCSGKK